MKGDLTAKTQLENGVWRLSLNDFFYRAKTSNNELSTVHFYSQYLAQLKRMSVSAHAISTSCSSFCAAELQLLAILRSLAVSASGSLMFSPEMTAHSGGF